MPIDEKGRLFLDFSQSQSPYIKHEQFTASDGSLCYRDVQIIPDSIDMSNYDLESCGFFQSLLYSEVKKTEVFTPIPNSNNFRRSTALMLSVYRVTPDRDNSLLKIMPSGVYLRQFKANGKDITISYFNSSSQVSSGNYTLQSEKIVDAKIARTLISSGQAYADLSLRRELGLPNN